MQYAILCYNDENAIATWTKEEDDACLARLAKVEDDMAAKGRMGPVARLLPTTAATTLRKSATGSMIIDGPFAETKEQFLGFYTLECADLDEAVEFARELSEVNPSGGSYEIRPVSVFNPTKVAV